MEVRNGIDGRYVALLCGCEVMESGIIIHCTAHYLENTEPDENEYFEALAMMGIE